VDSGIIAGLTGRSSTPRLIGSSTDVPWILATEQSQAQRADDKGSQAIAPKAQKFRPQILAASNVGALVVSLLLESVKHALSF
jgi:hypothetical protein